MEISCNLYKNDLALLRKMLDEINCQKSNEEVQREQETKEKSQPRTQDLGELIAIFNTREDSDSDLTDSEDELDRFIEKEKNIIVKPLVSTTTAETTPEYTNELMKILMEFRKKIECKACGKSFDTNTALHFHYEKNSVCLKWNAQKINNAESFSPEKGIHMWLYDVLEQVVAESDNKLQCKFCETKFINKGNLHKHFTGSVACNRFAFYELKKMIDTLLIFKKTNE